MTRTMIVSTIFLISAGVVAGLAGDEVRDSVHALTCEAIPSPGLKSAPFGIQLTDINETIIVSARDNVIYLAFNGHGIRSANIEFFLLSAGRATQRLRELGFVLGLACDADGEHRSEVFMTRPGLKVVPLPDVNEAITVTARANVVEMKVSGFVVRSPRIELRIAELLRVDSEHTN